MKSNLEPCIKGLALKYKAFYKKSLENSLRWAKRNYDRYQGYVSNHWDSFKYETNLNYIRDEFLFQGFIPEHKLWKTILPKYKAIHFFFITSNCTFDGEKLIYPVPCTVYADYLNQGYPNIYNLLSRVGIPGFTQVDERLIKINKNGNKKKHK